MKRTGEALLNVYGFESVPAISAGVKRAATQLDMGVVPMHEREDLFASNASGINKGTREDYHPLFLKDEDIQKYDEATIRYQQAAGVYMGGRLIREMDLPPFKWARSPATVYHRIAEDHFLNVAAEAPYGLNSVDPMVRAAFNHQKVLSTGASNRMRASGFERDVNPKIYPRLPTGLPFSVEPQRRTVDADRINSKMVEPISVFPPIGF